MSKLTLKTEGDRFIVATRWFAAAGNGLSGPYRPGNTPEVAARP
jgi:hypothetical protein